VRGATHHRLRQSQELGELSATHEMSVVSSQWRCEPVADRTC